MVGSTGVGKTPSTAKLAAAFATKYGASNLGLVTLDAYRVGAHEQLRTYGRILGVPRTHAHDRASLEDCSICSPPRRWCSSTRRMAQRDTRNPRTAGHARSRLDPELLVVNAAQQARPSRTC